MKNKNELNIKTGSIFEEPIMLDGKPLGVPKHDEQDFLDITDIFSGPDWHPFKKIK